jgi:phosphate transport system permease protein
MTRNIEEALSAIPTIQREGGLALGLSKWETTTQIILPAAIPSIITGIILASGRVFGEAAALIYTAGQSSPPRILWNDWNPMHLASPISFFRSGDTLAVHIWALKQEGLGAGAQVANHISAGASAVLILFVLLFNFGARLIGRMIHKRLTAEN